MTCACGGASSAPWIDWPDVPLVNELPKPGEVTSSRYRLRVVRCLACGTARVVDPPPPEVIFTPDYPYQSGVSRPFVDHANRFAHALHRRLAAWPVPTFVIDVGSNDGTLAHAIRRPDVAVREVDPARPEAEIQGFFPDVSRGWQGGVWHAITAFNVFAHIPDPRAFAAEAYRLVQSDGWFVVEVSDVADVLAGARLDTVYHEHMWYWSRPGLVRVLESVGFAVRDIETFPAQGGVMRVWAQKAVGPAYAVNTVPLVDDEPWQRALDIWDNRVSILRGVLDDGRRWAAYSAAAKGAMLAYALGDVATRLAYVVDETPDKQGRLTPYGVPIVPPETLDVDPVDGVVILAWNYAREIREKLRRFGGQVVVA